MVPTANEEEASDLLCGAKTISHYLSMLRLWGSRLNAFVAVHG